MRFSGTLFTIMMLLVASSAMALNVNKIGTYQSLVFDEGAAEIVAHDWMLQKLYFTNANANTVDRLDISDPANPVLDMSIDMSTYGGGVNSVAFSDLGFIAVAVEANVSTDPGMIVFFDQGGMVEGTVTVGALPDMVTFTPDGQKCVVACEGEPDGNVDPEGSVWVIEMNSFTAHEIDFTQFDGQEAQLIADGVLLEPGVPASQDLEPEYIAISDDGMYAFCGCQEAAAMVTVDLSNYTIVSLLPAGLKDHSLPGNALDASNDDGMVNIQNWPVYGTYQADAIAFANINEQWLIFSANEGDARDHTEARVHDLDLDDTVFPDEATLLLDENLGRLHVRTDYGDIDNDGDYDMLYAYGARSFSIWNGNNGDLVWDSGEEFEQILFSEFSEDFNSNNDENGSFDSRSDDKGGEPEAIAIGWVDGTPYAFIGLERMSVIMVYDVSDPTSPMYVMTVSNRDFDPNLDPSVPADLAMIGDLGPEDIKIVSADHSPTGSDLMIVANEVSGSITFYELSVGTDPVTLTLTPDMDPVEIPAAGGSFMYDLEIMNNSAQAGYARVWATATTPMGYDFFIQSAVVYLAANNTFTVNGLMQNVPAGVPAGMYSYNVMVGDLGQNMVLAEDSFMVNKLGVVADGATEWSLFGLPQASADASDAILPSEFAITSAYPNPFNPTTTVNIALPQAGELNVAVFNTLGQQVATLAQGQHTAGVHNFTFDGANLASGIYLIQASSEMGSDVRKVMLMK